ncbi:MAG: hypothetical protein EBS36_06630 [Actinobacteria bacterium]|nr:hypothetical protein [Actinomycetota bacterium]
MANAHPELSSNLAKLADVVELRKHRKTTPIDTLPLEWTPTSGANALAYAPPVPHLIALDESGHRHTSRAELPSAHQWSIRLVHGLVEVINGVRPASQLTRWLTLEVMAQVKNRIYANDMRRLTVRSVHVSEPDDGVAEVCAVFGTQNRCYALALRLEGLDGRWRATQLTWGM